MKRLAEKDQGVISTQIVQEFYVAATRKLGSDPLLVKSIIKSLMHFELGLIDSAVIDQAIDISLAHTLSFWDALVVAAAHHAHCDFLWSEDLNSGQIIHGVEIKNPFLQLKKIGPTD